VPFPLREFLVDCDGKKITTIEGLVDPVTGEVHPIQRAFMEKMGFQLVGTNVLIPPYRTDILQEVDLVEDVAIAYGYNNLPKTLPNFFTSGSLNRREMELEEQLRNMGFVEIKTFTLTNSKKILASGLEMNGTPVSNPASEEYTTLRPSLLPSFLEVININKTRNVSYAYIPIKIGVRKELRNKFIVDVAQGLNTYILLASSDKTDVVYKESVWNKYYCTAETSLSFTYKIEKHLGVTAGGVFRTDITNRYKNNISRKVTNTGFFAGLTIFL